MFRNPMILSFIHHRQNPLILFAMSVWHPSIHKSWHQISSTSGGRSVGIVRSRTKGHGVCFCLCLCICKNNGHLIYVFKYSVFIYLFIMFSLFLAHAFQCLGILYGDIHLETNMADIMKIRVRINCVKKRGAKRNSRTWKRMHKTQINIRNTMTKSDSDEIMYIR
jgi:hypothetical protein